MPMVTMAAPFTQSNVYLVPDPAHLGNLARIRNKKSRIILIKCIETFFICLALLLFVLGNDSTAMHSTDIFMSVTFGLCLMYTLLALVGPVNHTARSLIFFNFGAGLLLAIAAVTSIVSYIPAQQPLEEQTQPSSNMHDNGQKFISMKLSSGVILVMNAILYIGESFAMFIYAWDNAVITHQINL